MLFGAHWSSFLFWPLVGALWGVLANNHDLALNAPFFGALMGGGVALVFHLIESNHPHLFAACYGLLCGLIYGLVANPPETMLYMVIGSILALLGRPLVNFFPLFLS